MDKEKMIEWLKAAGIRALRTAAQGAVTLIGSNAVAITSLDWAQIAGICATMAVCSLLTSVAGLPETEG